MIQKKTESAWEFQLNFNCRNKPSSYVKDLKRDRTLLSSYPSTADMSQTQEWSSVMTYESASRLPSVLAAQNPTESRNVHDPSGSSDSQQPFTIVSSECTNPRSGNSSPIKFSGNASSPSPTVSAGRRRHTSSRSSSIHRSTSSISRRFSEPRRIEGGINKNRSSTIASPKARIPMVAAIETHTAHSL